jgi:predicted dehydrogenase
MTNKITWGILGCGDVTEIKSGPAFNKVAHSNIEAVMRRNAAKAADYAKRHQIEKWYSTADELINDNNINSIYIATPPAPHKEYAIRALQAGKNVYIEKPVTINVKECEDLIEAEKINNNKVTVAHYRRALPLFLKVKELIESKAIGDIRAINLQLYQRPNSSQIAQSEENWRINPAVSGGGLFYDLAPHQLDILIFIFDEPLHYQGFSCNQTKTNQVADITTGHILFKNDVVFNGIWNFNALPENEVEKCEIIGSKGKLDFPFFGHHINLFNENGNETFQFEPPQHVQQNMIEKTVKYFLGEGENPGSLEDALLSLKIMECFGEIV